MRTGLWCVGGGGWIGVMGCVAGGWYGVTCMHMSPQSVEERCKEEQHSNLPPQSVSPMAVAARDVCACTVCSTPLSPWCTELSLSAAPLQLVSSTTGELWCAPQASSAGSYFPVHVYAWCEHAGMYVCMCILYTACHFSFCSSACFRWKSHSSWISKVSVRAFVHVCI